MNFIKNIQSNGREGRIDLVNIVGEEMILKTINDEKINFPEVRGNAVLEKYKILKENGLPVVPNLNNE